jgi:hypothetical protein
MRMSVLCFSPIESNGPDLAAPFPIQPKVGATLPVLDVGITMVRL